MPALAVMALAGTVAAQQPEPTPSTGGLAGAIEDAARAGAVLRREGQRRPDRPADPLTPEGYDRAAAAAALAAADVPVTEAQALQAALDAAGSDPERLRAALDSLRARLGLGPVPSG